MRATNVADYNHRKEAAIGLGPGALMNVSVWKHHALNN